MLATVVLRTSSSRRNGREPRGIELIGTAEPIGNVLSVLATDYNLLGESHYLEVEAAVKAYLTKVYLCNSVGLVDV